MRMTKWLPLFIGTGGMIALDQLSKEWVLQNLQLGETIQPIPALAPLFQVTRSYNTGAAFGLLPDASWLFLVASIGISLYLLVQYVRSTPSDHLLRISMALIMGGAVGNVVDRLQHGHVVDFFHITIPNLISNVSNFADHAIVLGVGLLIVDSLLKDRAEKRARLQEVNTVASETE